MALLGTPCTQHHGKGDLRSAWGRAFISVVSDCALIVAKLPQQPKAQGHAANSQRIQKAKEGGAWQVLPSNLREYLEKELRDQRV